MNKQYHPPDSMITRIINLAITSCCVAACISDVAVLFLHVRQIRQKMKFITIDAFVFITKNFIHGKIGVCNYVYVLNFFGPVVIDISYHRRKVCVTRLNYLCIDDSVKGVLTCTISPNHVSVAIRIFTLFSIKHNSANINKSPKV